MHKKKIIGWLALLVLVTSLSAQETAPNYFPLQIGTRWTYSVKDQKEMVSLVAVREEKVGEQLCVRIELRIKDSTASTEHIAVLRDGIYRFKVDENIIGPPVCFMKSPAKKGEKWTNTFKINDKEGKVTYSTDAEDVEVGAGKFKGALVVIGETIENGIPVKMKNWYAADVGMVKQVIEAGKDLTILELEKVERVEMKK